MEEEIINKTSIHKKGGCGVKEDTCLCNTKKLEKTKEDIICCELEKNPCSCGIKTDTVEASIKPTKEKHENNACCGKDLYTESNSFELPGYKLCSFVDGFKDTPAGQVPIIKTKLGKCDILSTIMVRSGINRYDYKLSPGLYCVGKPDTDSPVFVSANYKLSFDFLRRDISGINAWILVLDTHGVNVWCAAGKKTFSSQEIINRIKSTNLDKVVKHRKIILPQLSATGVSAKIVKKNCAFKVIWGPIRSQDIKKFLRSDMQADDSMRQVTFSIQERITLVPVELSLIGKPVLFILLTLFILSGIGPDIFSLYCAWTRGKMACLSIIAGIFAGAVITPIFLPWIPGRAFSLKGTLTGLFVGFWPALLFWDKTGLFGAFSLIIFTVALSSNLSMNFTGATPFTSPSGVEKEMRKAIPLQIISVTVGILMWLGSAFIA